MYFHVNGRKHLVIVDDLIPCRVFASGAAKPLFAFTKQHELWAMLLEKAWAKLFGSYRRT